MAIDNDLPSVKLPLDNFNSASSTTSSVSSSNNTRRPLVQVATNNSATFIQFPVRSRQSSPFVPLCRPRTSQSSARLSSNTPDTQSLSNQSKTSEPARTFSSDESDHKRVQSQQRANPILENPLLNHRKSPVKYPPIKSANESSRKTRLCQSAKPFKPLSNNIQLATIRASTVPPIVHPQENNMNISDRLLISIDNTPSEHQKQYVDNNKYDYITRWLNEVRAATCSNAAFQSESKSTKRRLIPA